MSRGLTFRHNILLGSLSCPYYKYLNTFGAFGERKPPGCTTSSNLKTAQKNALAQKIKVTSHYFTYNELLRYPYLHNPRSLCSCLCSNTAKGRSCYPFRLRPSGFSSVGFSKHHTYQNNHRQRVHHHQVWYPTNCHHCRERQLRYAHLNVVHHHQPIYSREYLNIGFSSLWRHHRANDLILQCGGD
jgi:hypothetical protein